MCSMAHKTGRGLFELIPDVFPYGMMTDLEMEVWVLFYEDLDARRKQK